MRWIRIALVLGAVVLVGGNFLAAFTAANAVPATRVGEATDTITALKLRPSGCSSVAVTALVTGSGTFTGTTAAELLLGSAAVDSIGGAAGNDCLVGGNGNDTLNGGQGTDVCLGQGGTDTFSACETQVQ